MYFGRTRSKVFLKGTPEIDTIQRRSSTEGKMCLLHASFTIIPVSNCPRKLLRDDVGLGDLTMVEWHSIAIHVFLIAFPRFGTTEEKPSHPQSITWCNKTGNVVLGCETLPVMFWNCPICFWDWDHIYNALVPKTDGTVHMPMVKLKEILSMCH